VTLTAGSNKASDFVSHAVKLPENHFEVRWWTKSLRDLILGRVTSQSSVDVAESLRSTEFGLITSQSRVGLNHLAGWCCTESLRSPEYGWITSQSRV